MTAMGSAGVIQDGEITVTMETSGGPAESLSKESVELASDDGRYVENEGICMSSWPSYMDAFAKHPSNPSVFAYL